MDKLVKYTAVQYIESGCRKFTNKGESVAKQ